jgi:EmrB/QacA subfamily drug resistance transporter
MTASKAQLSRWWTLGIACICSFMLILDLSIVAIALPSIRSSLNASLSDLQWVFDAYAVALAAALIISGEIADRYGRKRIFLIGLVIFTAGSLACGFAASAPTLDAGRAVQGLGAAVLYAVGPALLSNEFHGRERATAFSAFGAATGVAAAVGPLIGGALTSGPGWRWIFFINVPIAVVVFPLAVRCLRESRKPGDATAPAIVRAVAFTLCLGVLVLAITRGNANGWFSVANIVMYLAAAALAVALVGSFAARRGRGLAAAAEGFGNRTFVGSCAATLLVNACGFPFIFIATTYMQSILNSSAWEAGLHFLPMTAAMFVFGAVAGELCKRVPLGLLFGFACLAVGAGALLLWASNAGDSWISMTPAMVVVGAGIGVIMPVRAALSVSVFEPAKSAVASGISETSQQVGIAIGLAVVGAFFENRVVHAFVGTASGRALGAAASNAGRAISAGATQSVTAAAPSGLAGRMLHDADVAFAAGLHQSMTLGAIFAVAAALIAVLSIRNSDLHPGARLDGTPPDTAEGLASDLSESRI